MKKDIFLFGASGFLGKNISSFLSKRDIPFHTITRQECDARYSENIERILDKSEDGELCIINAAAVSKAANNTYESFLDNIAIGHAFYAAAQNIRIASFIHISSFDVYGNAPQNPITENSRLAPDTWYGLAKVAVEHIFAMSPSLKNALTILRMPGIYALNDTDSKSIVARLSEKIQNRQTIMLENKGKSLRDYVNAEDVARIVEYILRTGKNYGTVNVATGESVLINSIVDTLASYIGIAAVNKYTASSGRAFDIITDVTKLKTVFPDHHPQSLLKTLKDFYTSSI